MILRRYEENACQDKVAVPSMKQQALQKAMATPWEHGFIPLLRAISAQHNEPPAGEADRPQQEGFRLGQQPSLTFAPREIADIRLQDERLHIRLFGLGMLGPNGPLPIHFTEIAKDRLDNRRDATLVNFLDLFHHRFLTQFYRAWAQAQAAAGIDRRDDERFSRYVSRLIGVAPTDSKNSHLPQHARLAAAPHLIMHSRHPDGLSATLAHYFSIPVRMTEHLLHWIDVAPEEHTKLGYPSLASVLGEGALAGEKVPDRQHKFRLTLGPLSLAQYLRFTPQGEDLPVLIDWVRAFVGLEYEWEVELKVAAFAAPAACLGDQQRLGWSTWLGDTSAQAVTTGMIFIPEQIAAVARTHHHGVMRKAA